MFHIIDYHIYGVLVVQGFQLGTDRGRSELVAHAICVSHNMSLDLSIYPDVDSL